MNSRFLGIFCDTPTVVNILGQLTVDSSFFCINVYCLLIIKYQKILLQKSSWYQSKVWLYSGRRPVLSRHQVLALLVDHL